MKVKIILTVVFLLALILRFYKLADFRCLNWDEAAFGYNAYSILTTGADEYGTRLPLQFKSVGDYKGPLYVYLAVPMIKLLGLNSFAIRFLPALMGSLSAVSVYFIVVILTKRKAVALVTALFTPFLLGSAI
jgi:4-amino-4-deoxy-L-arabinose transferase-like glycosyltransferase